MFRLKAEAAGRRYGVLNSLLVANSGAAAAVCPWVRCARCACALDHTESCIHARPLVRARDRSHANAPPHRHGKHRDACRLPSSSPLACFVRVYRIPRARRDTSFMLVLCDQGCFCSTRFHVLFADFRTRVPRV